MIALRKRNWLFIALLVAMVLLIIAGLGLLGAYFFLAKSPQGSSAAWQTPVEAVRPGAVAPDLAVLTLAGESDERIIQAALEAGEVETAYTTLAYSVLIPDALRGGNWLLLASRYTVSDPGRAAICYAAALDAAIFSPTLSDGGRADLALQAARGFAALKKPAIARLALGEAESIARYSLTLLPAQRLDVLTKVVAAYQGMGDVPAAAALRPKLEAYTAGPGVKLDPTPPLLPELRGGILLPAELTALVVARQRAAADLAARWLPSSPQDRNILVGVLTQALAAEDAARIAFYADGAGLPIEDRLVLLHDEVAWLTVKYRVARGAFGSQLARDWQAQPEQIRDELVRAYTDLINGYGQQLDTLNAADAGLARVEVLRQGLLWARLGLFPGQVEAPLSEQLAEAMNAVGARQGGIGLTFNTQQAEGRTFYLLAGAEEIPAK